MLDQLCRYMPARRIRLSEKVSRAMKSTIRSEAMPIAIMFVGWHPPKCKRHAVNGFPYLLSDGGTLGS